MEKIVNALGKACPIPVVLAKKAMDGLKKGDILRISVDNEIAVSNLQKLAAQQGGAFSCKKVDEKNYQVSIVVEKEGEKEGEQVDSCMGCRELPSSGKKTVAVISSNAMGSGDDELGQLLLKGFIYALTQLERLPSAVLLYNGGAKISTEGSSSLEDLKYMEEQGTEILTCGTCLNHFGLTEKLQVGKVTNMYQIVEIMAGADHILRP